jgi:MerR family transcriptional regulator, copper efflux regulator
MDRLTIGDVAKQAQVHIETLRYYERRGLLARPPRSLSNYRLYSAETVRRVRFIKGAQQLGFSLKEIRELLSLRAEPETSCEDIRERAAAKLPDIEAKIASLQAMKHALAKPVTECSGSGSITDCPILEAFDPGKGV